MSPDPTAQSPLSIAPTYSAKEAAVLLGRLQLADQRVRGGQFVMPDGTVVQPLRTPGGFRRFTLAMSKTYRRAATDTAGSRWRTEIHLPRVLVAAHHDTGEYKIPS